MKQVSLTAIDPFFVVRADLNDELFFLKFDWNDAEGRWEMSISDRSNTAIAMGLPLNEREDLITRFRVSFPALPKGVLFLFDTTGQGVECGRNDLGDRCVLLFSPDA